MTKLAIVATAEIAAGRMEEVLTLLMAHRSRCLAEEPGTLRFEVLRPRHDDSTIMLYEVYNDDAAFASHWNGPLVARSRVETTGLTIKLSGTRCDLQE